MRFLHQGWVLVISVFLLSTSKGEACAPSRFSLETFQVGERNGGTLMAAVLETSDPKCLREYGVVQYVRGCLYNVRYQRRSNTISERYFGIAREHRGKSILFNHPDWVVDTIDEDPLYQGVHSAILADGSSAGRLDNYRYAKGTLRFDGTSDGFLHDREVILGRDHQGPLSSAPADTRQYFISDLPTYASWNPKAGKGEEEWVNASLDFKTCLYRLRDIPTEGAPLPPGVSEQVGGPIQCLDWGHRKRFDPKSNRFQSPELPDTACSEISAKLANRGQRISSSR